MRIVSYSESAQTCVWSDLFSNDERVTLQRGFLLTGSLSVIFSCWMTAVLLFTSLRNDRSYRNLANYTAAACIRRIVPILLYLPLVKYIGTLYGFEKFSCELFAFLETFLAVLEVECLTHVCIERYVVAKYITNGWPIQKKHYDLYICLCVLFSCLYSVPPLLGVGRYGFDFQCTSCTYDMVLSDSWQRYFVVTTLFLRSVKPAIVMTMMLAWARALENKLPNQMSNQSLTRGVTAITLVNLLCWAPIAFIRGSVLLSYLMYMDFQEPSGAYISWAMWIHWIAPAFSVIALSLTDDRVRANIFSLWSNDLDATNDENKSD